MEHSDSSRKQTGRDSAGREDTGSETTGRRSSKLEMLAIAGLLGLLVWSFQRPSEPLVEAGMPLPELMAEGWLNSPGPVSRERLLGKIVVVDCWATWCGPCRAAMPRLAKLYTKYEPFGVVFVGLTSEPEARQGTIEQFIASVPGFDWPVGYGSAPTFDALGIEVLPTVIVFGSQGRAIWSGSHLDGLAEVLDGALARQ